MVLLKQVSVLYQLGQKFPWMIYSTENLGVGYYASYAKNYFKNFNGSCTSVMHCQIYPFSSLQHDFSNTCPTFYSGQSSTSKVLLEKLGLALSSDHVDDAWETFSNFKRLYGFPSLRMTSKLIILMSTSSSHWLQKAYDLVIMIHKKKPHLLYVKSLSRLALSLVRNQMVIPSATITRIMLEKKMHLPMHVWCYLFSHMVKTQIGSFLASNILIEICESFLIQLSNRKTTQRVKLMKPDITIFNLVLDSCSRYGSTLKAEKVIELMSKLGVVADANSVVAISRIFEMLGRRDELQELRHHIHGMASATLNRHYQQFYDCLLSLHFNYNDIDAAGELVLELYQRSRDASSCMKNSRLQLQKHCLLHFGSKNFKVGYKLLVAPELLRDDFVVEARSYLGLIEFVDGKLFPSRKAFSKLITGYVRERKVPKLSNLLISIEQELHPKKNGLITDVVDAFIQAGWLEAAHDILDDLLAAEVPVGDDAFTSLLYAYHMKNMQEELKVLLLQIRKAGCLVSFPFLEDEDASIHNSQTIVSPTKKSDLAMLLLSGEGKVEEDTMPHLVYEFNSMISFFCNAGMIEDALKTLKQMQRMHILPTLQTFQYIVSCYSSMNKYREITVMWGQIKGYLVARSLLPANRDLFEFLLLNFLRAGYFERAMEVISYMTKYDMFMDKWKYRCEFLNLHKDLYRKLRAADANTEAQSKRLEHVKDFRIWAGIDQTRRNRRGDSSESVI